MLLVVFAFDFVDVDASDVARDAPVGVVLLGMLGSLPTVADGAFMFINDLLLVLSGFQTPFVGCNHGNDRVVISMRADRKGDQNLTHPANHDDGLRTFSAYG